MMSALAIIGGFIVARQAIAVWRLLFTDRDGTSGRYKHWSEE